MFTIDPILAAVSVLWIAFMIIYRLWLGKITKDSQSVDTWLITAALVGFIASLYVGSKEYPQYHAMFFATLLSTFAIVEVPMSHRFYHSRIVIGMTGPMITLFIVVLSNLL